MHLKACHTLWGAVFILKTGGRQSIIFGPIITTDKQIVNGALTVCSQWQTAVELHLSLCSDKPYMMSLTALNCVCLSKLGLHRLTGWAASYVHQHAAFCCFCTSSKALDFDWELFPLTCHARYIRGICASPDGCFIICSKWSAGLLKLWALILPDLFWHMQISGRLYPLNPQ